MGAMQDETTSFIRRAISAMAKKYSVTPTNVMLFIEHQYFNDGSCAIFKVAIDNGSGFKMIMDENFNKEEAHIGNGTKIFQFHEILGRSLNIDPIVAVKEAIAMPFLDRLLTRIEQDYKIDIVSARILTSEAEIKNLFFLIYDKDKKIDQVDYNYIFQDEQ